MLNLNTMLSLIFQCKKTGSGKLGNGRIYVKLMQIIADQEDVKLSAEMDILKRFGNSTADTTAYQRIDKFLSRYLKTGKSYPYKLFRFEKFESRYGTDLNYFVKAESFCDEVIHESKLLPFVHTLLEIIRQDNSVDTLIYGNRIINKNELFGNYAHPKKICVEALLLGILHYLHKNPSEGKTLTFAEVPQRIIFSLIRYKNKESLNPESAVDLEQSLVENALKAYVFENEISAPKRKYSLELRCEHQKITHLPENENIFLFGTGGSGKSTILLNEIKSTNSVSFYLPLYRYKEEIHNNFQAESCYILTHILLKYFYQYEYLTYENAAACEGETEILKQLTALNNLLKSPPVCNIPRYTLLLDGLNEIPSEVQIQLISELEYIMDKWKNIRIIITGRTVPNYSMFSAFRHIEVCGILDSQLNDLLEEYPETSANSRLRELLKTPLFLNMFLENKNGELNTQGEILDSYIMNIQSRLPEESLVRFAVQYALPFAAKKMTDNFEYEIDRGDLSEAMDNAAELYLLNERVYQNYIAPKKYRKKSLLESRENTDIVELLIDNVCFLTASNHEPQKLHFTHQYFRDYFAAKQIINLGEAVWNAYEYSHTDERTALFKKYDLDVMWFYEEDDIYRLIGEISGDYKNAPSFYFCYHKTVLDSILYMSKSASSMHTAQCVIKAMSLVRGNIICGVDFRQQYFCFKLPDGIRFSMDGEYPCDFSGSWIMLADFADITATAVSSDRRYRLTAFENGYVIMCDCRENKIVWERSFSEYTEDGRSFEFAVFSKDNKNAEIVSCNSVLRIDTLSGRIISSKHEKGLTVIDEYFEFTQKYPKCEESITDELKTLLISQFSHFKNCDFTNAEFFDDEAKKLLNDMGAIL